MSRRSVGRWVRMTREGPAWRIGAGRQVQPVPVRGRLRRRAASPVGGGATGKALAAKKAPGRVYNTRARARGGRV